MNGRKNESEEIRNPKARGGCVNQSLEPLASQSPERPAQSPKATSPENPLSHWKCATIVSISAVKPFQKTPLTFPVCSNPTFCFPQILDRFLPKSFAREIAKPLKKGLEKEPINLWHRYVDWLYHHKELGLLLEVSRIGSTDELLEQVEPKIHKAFCDRQDLEPRSPDLQKSPRHRTFYND